MVRVGSVRGFWWCVVAPLLAACGGSFAPGPGSGGAPASAGGGAAAESGATGGGAAAESGATASGGAAGGSCVYQGKTYTSGMGFPAGDGCNNCGCENGNVSCTEIGCENQCGGLQGQYAAALERAKACDRTSQSDQCGETAAAALPCGCSTPVDASNAEAVHELSTLAGQSLSACGESFCAPCLPPRPATCSAAGRCEEAPLRDGESACKVGGVVYPSGATGVPDLDGCNTCTCSDGELRNCTKVGCAFACLTGTVRGTQCGKCGPSDACEAVETACLPTCTDACSDGRLCSNGLCRNVCG